LKAKFEGEIQKAKNESKTLQKNVEDKNNEISKLYANKFGDKFTIVEEKISNLEAENLKKDKIINDLDAKDFYSQTLLKSKEDELALEKIKNDGL
jgi:hypothetical protein